MSASHSRRSLQRGTCQLCSKEMPRGLLVAAEALRPGLFEHIAAQHPDLWHESSMICKACLAQERLHFALDRLEQERGELTSIEEEIARKASRHESLAANVERLFETEATLGQRLADRVAAVGGSWPFVAVFFVLLLLWAALNSVLLGSRAFDPYPYILLNLGLSCLAAVQAPIIMMSQNRVAARDRLQANQDFRINLKAELEIASLHEKVDHLLHSQWQHMVELQELQLDLLNELSSRSK